MDSMEYWLKRGDSEYSFDVPYESRVVEVLPTLVKNSDVESKMDEASSIIEEGSYVFIDYLPLPSLYASILNALLKDKECELFVSAWRCGENLEEWAINSMKEAGLRSDVRPAATQDPLLELVKGEGVVLIHPETPHVLCNPESARVLMGNFLYKRYRLGTEVIERVLERTDRIGISISPSGELLDVSINGEIIDSRYKVNLSTRADCVMVSAGGEPFDLTLYQALNVALLASNVVLEGGVIVLSAECREGIGSRSLVKLMYETYVQHNRLDENLDECYARVAEMLQRVKDRSKLCLVSVLPRSYAEGIFGFRLFDSLQEALHYAVRVRGRSLSVHIIPYGTFTFPFISE